MGRIRALPGVISLSAGLLFTTANLAVAAQPAPELVLNLTGQQVNLSDYQGQVIYLDFWASWCKPCQRSFPWMNEMQAKYGEQGFTVIAINLDSERKLADEFLARLPAHFPVAFDPDGNSAQTYKLKGMPTSYLIDKAGNLRVAHQGFHVEKQARYEQEIKGLLAE